jgi:hypothetical protein
MIGVKTADDSRHTLDPKVISSGPGVTVGGTWVVVGVGEGGIGLGGIVGVLDRVGVGVLVGDGNRVGVNVADAVKVLVEVEVCVIVAVENKPVTRLGKLQLIRIPEKSRRVL